MAIVAAALLPFYATLPEKDVKYTVEKIEKVRHFITYDDAERMVYDVLEECNFGRALAIYTAIVHFKLSWLEKMRLFYVMQQCCIKNKGRLKKESLHFIPNIVNQSILTFFFFVNAL